jgi:hypothetical protein
MRPLTSDEVDLGRFLATFSLEGSEKSPELLAWQYLANPFGELRVLAEDVQGEPTFAAIYAMNPKRMRIGGQLVMALQSVDTLTSKQHRGRGLFVTLATEAYRQAAADGYQGVYGFPNGNSIHGFTTKLNWSQLDPVPFLIRPIRVAYFSAAIRLPRRLLSHLAVPPFPVRVPDRYRVTEAFPSDFEIDDLWEHVVQRHKIAVERNSQFLRWRLARPGADYKLICLFEGTSLEAFCCYTLVEKHGGRIGYVMELLGKSDRAQSLALRLAVRNMHLQNADAVLAWSLEGSGNRSSFRKSRFFNLPARFRPIELHFGSSTFVADPAFTTRSNWYLSYLDSDTV